MLPPSPPRHQTNIYSSFCLIETSLVLVIDFVHFMFGGNVIISDRLLLWLAWPNCWKWPHNYIYPMITSTLYWKYTLSWCLYVPAYKIDCSNYLWHVTNRAVSRVTDHYIFTGFLIQSSGSVSMQGNLLHINLQGSQVEFRHFAW